MSANQPSAFLLHDLDVGVFQRCLGSVIGRLLLVGLVWTRSRFPRWEPEPLRWLGVNGGLKVMSTADAVEDRTGRPARRTSLSARLLGH